VASRPATDDPDAFAKRNTIAIDAMTLVTASTQLRYQKSKT
jgi:hypothetical protein